MMLLLAMIGLFALSEPPAGWEQLPSLQQTEGYAGAFAGNSNGHLLIAGGANFPLSKPWAGGTKKWYSHVYVYEGDFKRWRIVGELPRELAYGTSVSYGNKVICVGGSDAERHYNDVFSLEYKNAALQYEKLPSLPTALANSSGVLIGATLFVVGGQAVATSKTALIEVWSLDLANPESSWNKEPPLPGPGRILSMVGGISRDDQAVPQAKSEELYVFGGVELLESEGGVKRRYLRDAYVLRNHSQWERLPDIPLELAAGASPLPIWKDRIYIVGGDDGTQVGKFFPEHRGFANTIWEFDVRTHAWKSIGTTPAPRVTLPSYQSGAEVYFFSGEQSPGIRSPEVWRWNLKGISP